jgi:hypothetical protein
MACGRSRTCARCRDREPILSSTRMRSPRRLLQPASAMPTWPGSVACASRGPTRPTRGGGTPASGATRTTCSPKTSSAAWRSFARSRGRGRWRSCARRLSGGGAIARCWRTRCGREEWWPGTSRAGCAPRRMRPRRSRASGARASPTPRRTPTLRPSEVPRSGRERTAGRPPPPGASPVQNAGQPQAEVGEDIQHDDRDDLDRHEGHHPAEDLIQGHVRRRDALQVERRHRHRRGEERRL